MNRRTVTRTVAAGGLATLWVAGLVVTGLWYRLALSARPPDVASDVPGLQAPVEVLLDTLGIPTVFAAGEGDAVRALGWLHAEDRLWQMELFRRVGEGRLAEVFGAKALPTDRFVRTLGLPAAVERAAAALGPEEAARLDAYASGVNARLAAGGPPPPEFQLLRVRPRAWDARASLAVGMVMNLDLASWRPDLARFRIARRFGPDRLATLLEGYPAWGPTILDAPVATPPGAEPGMPGTPAAGAAPAVAGDPAGVP
ncbi:MAG: penicillin acylase family protein, partial [Gemmatimonadota bacterium]|nr:penicillin acylase family protein [Gemmatimonadota bacterium]